MIHFDDIFGQDSAIEAIASAYRADRLPHAMIFAGPVGVGKGTTARALAGLFLCERPRDLRACGKCESCRCVAADIHPDLHWIYRNLIRIIRGDEQRKPVDLPVEVVRKELIDKAAMTSVIGIGKVFIVEEADLMNMAGQNALLKTLEEPHGRTLIILLTDSPDGLLATVRSRCRTIRFSPLDPAVVETQLIKAGHAKPIAHHAAILSEGSLGLAIKWIEDGVIDTARELLDRLGRIVAGAAPVDMPEWFKNAADAYCKAQLSRDRNASENQAKRDGMLLYLRLAATELRRRLTHGGDPDSLERICAAIDALVRAEKYINANVTVALVFQELAVSLEEQFA